MYEQHLRATEANAWPLDTSIAWERIDRDAASREPELLAALYDAAIIEGYLPVFAPRLMQLLWDDVDGTAVLSMELYEGLRHYTALKRYLDLAGYVPAPVAERRLVAARERALHLALAPDQVIEHLTSFVCSELFAAYFFLRLSRQTGEPVLRQLLSYMARDEFRHAASAGDVLAKRIDADPSAAARVLAAAERFRHYGADVVDVPVAIENDFEAIAAMNRKIRHLCGLAPTEHLKEAMADADL